MNLKQYFKSIDAEVKKSYEVANRARAKGFDPVSKVEVPIATTLAEKAVGLISTVYPQLLDCGVEKKIMELEEEYGALETAVPFKIAEEIAREKFCKFKDLLEAIDAGIRVGFSYITLGVVSSPIEGYTELKIGKTREGKEYFKAFFSGPIRSAGTTAACVALMLIDYLRETFGYAKYDPSEEEVKRYVTENYDYHERVTNLQYLPTSDEITFLAKNLPIQICGEPTEQREVSNYKDLDRVESDFIRGGMCLIFSEGLAQKAQKGFRLLKSVKDKGFQATGWDFLDEFIEKFKMAKKSEGGDKNPVYVRDIVAGRPFLGHPSKSGGFRFRYGKNRLNGFSAMSVHPATMAVTDGFLSYGTQLKVEKPTKGCAISCCDGMDGPIVKMKDGSVKKLRTYGEAKDLYSKIEEIIYLGDLLVPFGDVLNRNYGMLKSGYVEEWWALELAKLGVKEYKGKIGKDVGFEEAVEISKKHGVGLYPEYIYFWKEIGQEEFLGMLDWLARGEIKEEKLILPYTQNDKERFIKGKRALELLGVEHEMEIEHVVFDGRALLFNLGIDICRRVLKESGEERANFLPARPKFERDGKKESGEIEGEVDRIIGDVKKVEKKEKEKEGEYILRIVNELCDLKIRDKSGTFVGCRMGRPEKAKLRKLTGSPHVLFPVGEEGGRLRSFHAAFDIGYVGGEFPLFYCSKCREDGVYGRCANCGGDCKRMWYCRSCEKRSVEKCEKHEGGIDYDRRKIDIRKYFDSAKKITRLSLDEIGIVKGVRGTSNKDHSCEHLAKGLIRAKYGLNVNKDGTIRYDMTEMPISHFKAKEIGTSVEKLREMGYEEDIEGKKITNGDQVLELFPHDVILPACKESGDEMADDVFLKISKFVDDELVRLYGLEKYFDCSEKNDMLGALVVCMAPHICTATVGRIIGFSKTQGMLASPYLHAAMRRDCDGDEAAAFLLMDMLLNFSRKFLPAHRGGTQDAPLVLNTAIRAGDVDDQILDFEVGEYPLGLYEDAEEGKHSSDVVGVEFVKDRLKEEKDPFTGLKYTHECSDINDCVVNSSYKSLPTMEEKVAAQMLLCKKIRAVDERDVARLTIERHFIRDTRGNLRKFSMQIFRCVGCNSKFRRPPLAGKCAQCGGKLIFTISEGSIGKYMQRSLDLANEFKVEPYLLESLELTQMYIESIFGRDPEKQEQIDKWF